MKEQVAFSSILLACVAAGLLLTLVALTRALGIV
jgi:hypothetical protein